MLPTRFTTVSCLGSLASMATPETLPFSLRTHTSMFSLVAAALDADDARPFGRLELAAHLFEVGRKVGALILELEALDVDAGDAPDQFLDFGLFGILAVEELARELQHVGVEREIDAVGCLGLQVIQVELELLRPERSGQRGAQGEG